jgi:hypothetical protein
LDTFWEALMPAGGRIAKEFAAWIPEPDSYKEELHRKHQAWRPERVRS